jgi:hypothetical protein
VKLRLKVGDKVRVKRDFNFEEGGKFKKGETGTILYLKRANKRSRPYMVLISWDNVNNRPFHNGNDEYRHTTKNCWYLHIDYCDEYLELYLKPVTIKGEKYV